MPTPKEVFDNPLQYLDFLQSGNFERQQFDWTEVRIDTNSQIDSVKDKIKECISAFANSNREGGLLVLGIADNGTIKGIQHIDEQTMNNILQARLHIVNHSTATRDVDLQDLAGNRLYLLYTPWEENAICETVGNFPKGWRRDGPQNFALIDRDREQLKRDKRIVDFETRYCCSYDPNELDLDVVEEFKDAFLEDRGAQYDDYTTEEVLELAGALTKEKGEYAFTNAGFLFFAANPRKRFASAFVRVLRFEVNVEESQERGVTTFDKAFDGALPNVIRKLQTFFKDSALFRTMIRRSSHGGFIEDPEYPLLAVDEAIVNAAIHRDYGATSPIHCIAYQNGLVVENWGSILQQVPQSFSLADTFLYSVLRNPAIVRWMSLMRDKRGEPLVRALREGTRKMRQEMANLGLPAPYYETTFAKTSVTLYNRLEERLEPHASTHTKSTPNNNTPSTASGHGNSGRKSDFIGESSGQIAEHVSKTNGGLSDLPENWAWTTFQEACSAPQYGWTTKATPDGTLHLLRTTDITSGNVNWETVPYCEKAPPEKEKYLLKTGDIVISRAGSVGYSYLVKNPQNAVFASYLIRFRPISKIIDENYLALFLKSPSYWKIISSEKAGITLLNVNATKLKQIEIPLPPMAEQGRIVAKLETLFTQLDEAIDSLKKAQVQLQRYRRSILKTAFEGKLTREWREAHPSELEPTSVSEVSTQEGLSELPEGWEWTTLANCAEILDSQRIPINAKERETRISGKSESELYPYYGATGRVGWIDDYLFDEELVLLGEDGAPFLDFLKDTAYLIRDKSWVNNHAHVLRAKSEVTSNQFLCHYLNTFDYHGYLTGTTRLKLNQSAMRKIPVPLSPLPEQKQVVSELERNLSVADEIEATIKSELKRSERLRQSILKHAFSGKLVPQDPNDEPASVLLEKIREEKEYQQSKQQKKTTKSKSQESDNYPLLALERNDAPIGDASRVELGGDTSE
ncbi:MAG: restriction endonuclease subunit S [Candidatus Poribacteria bacterium]|nr:restriction endonuclease subunit S [Candidatus Poribacteria bacterium]